MQTDLNILQWIFLIALLAVAIFIWLKPRKPSKPEQGVLDAIAKTLNLRSKDDKE